MSARDLFQPYWISFGLPNIREVALTYDGSDPLGPIAFLEAASDLQWLAPLTGELADTGMGNANCLTSNEELARRLQALRQTAPPGVPDAFWTLLSSTRLQDCIPSCTACYFDFPDQWLPSPFRTGDFMVRFMNDQQCCFCWYLYAPKDDVPFVVISSGVQSKTAKDHEAFLEGVRFEGHPERLEAARNSTFLAAPDFLSFIYRFRLENVIWHKLIDNVGLSAEELAYVHRIEPRYDPSDPEKTALPKERVQPATNKATAALVGHVTWGLLVGSLVMTFAASLTGAGHGWGSSMISSWSVVGAPLTGAAWALRGKRSGRTCAALALAVVILTDIGLWLGTAEEGLFYVWKAAEAMPALIFLWALLFLAWQVLALVAFVWPLQPK